MSAKTRVSTKLGTSKLSRPNVDRPNRVRPNCTARSYTNAEGCSVSFQITFNVYCMSLSYTFHFSLFTLFTFKNVRSTGPTYLYTNEEGCSVSFHITFNVYCISLSYTFHFSLSLPLKMSGPLGPRTYIQMQKGAVFHFTLHSMFTV